MPILHWLDRAKHTKTADAAPYRLLDASDEHSAGDPNTSNMLIQGDNLEALKALLPYYAGRVKCIYIDPPFNTQQAFENYDDNLEHSIWLGMMYPRLELLHRLLSEDGTIAVHIDDNELAYIIVILDEIFGRTNRVNACTFKQGSAVGHKAINPGPVTITNFVLLYAKNKLRGGWNPNRLFTGRDRDPRYGQFIVNIDDPFQTWHIVTLTTAFARHLGIPDKEARTIIKDDPRQIDNFVLRLARSVVRTARPDYDAVSEAARCMINASKASPTEIVKLSRTDHSDMYFKNGERLLFYSDKLKLVDGKYVAGEPLTTLWDDILSNNLHNEGGVEFPNRLRKNADFGQNP